MKIELFSGDKVEDQSFLALTFNDKKFFTQEQHLQKLKYFVFITSEAGAYVTALDKANPGITKFRPLTLESNLVIKLISKRS
jgi:hypothetical protein